MTGATGGRFDDALRASPPELTGPGALPADLWAEPSREDDAG